VVPAQFASRPTIINTPRPKADKRRSQERGVAAVEAKRLVGEIKTARPVKFILAGEKVIRARVQTGRKEEYWEKEL